MAQILANIPLRRDEREGSKSDGQGSGDDDSYNGNQGKYEGGTEINRPPCDKDSVMESGSTTEEQRYETSQELTITQDNGAPPNIHEGSKAFNGQQSNGRPEDNSFEGQNRHRLGSPDGGQGRPNGFGGNQRDQDQNQGNGSHQNSKQAQDGDSRDSSQAQDRKQSQNKNQNHKNQHQNQGQNQNQNQNQSQNDEV